MEQEYTAEESMGNSGADQPKRVVANKIPKPVPAGEHTTINPSEQPLSDETISIKRSALKPTKETPISFDDQNSHAGATLTDDTPAEPGRRLKIFCYNCAQKLDLTDMKPFSTIDCPSCDREIIVPKWWDNYLLEESCGLGGMAKVYRGLDLALDREVAIKILDNDTTSDDSRSKLFLHEARTAATLNHYAILPIYTCGEFEGQAYFVMQYMGGGSLEQELDRDEDHPLTISESSKWLKDICEALDNARRHGIIHHDIKPGNFMLDADRNVKIGDFGISQALHDSRSAELTELTKNWGSPDYVSPEKITSKSETYLGDIYSLGATFYHLLTKETPYDNHDVASMLKAKTVKDPIDIRKLRSDIPDEIAKLIMSMMDRTPEARPTYRDIIAELNSMKKVPIKKSASSVKRKRAAAPKPKKQPVVKQAVVSTSINVDKEALENFDPAKYGIKKRNSILSLIKAVIFLGILTYGGFYLWDNGYLGGIIPNAPGMVKSDYLPEVTKLVREGKSIDASKLANMKLKTSNLSGGSLKQAAIQLSINTYLNNEPNPNIECNSLMQRLLSNGISIDAPEIILLKYLAEKNANADKIRGDLSKFEAKENLKAMELMLVGEIAIFVKSVYLNSSKVEMRTALTSYASLSEAVDGDYWGLGWGDRIQVWYDWTSSPKVNLSKLEPLFRRTKSGFILMQESNQASTDAPKPSFTMGDLTEEWLTNNRSFAAARPKAEDFSLTEALFSAYIAGLPDEYKQQESDRSKLLSRIKFNLCKNMLIKPYKGIVKKLDGTSVSGTIIANANGLVVHNSETHDKLQWSDLHIVQFVKMLTFYAKEMEKKNVSVAAKEYLNIAVLLDWYSSYKHAVTFANRAVAIDNSLEQKVLATMMQ